MSLEPRLVVFDWDGTLVDSAERIVDACRTAFAQCGHPPPAPQRIRELIGLGLEDTFAILLPSADRAEVRRAAARYRELWAIAATSPSPLFPTVRPTLEVLVGSGVRLAVATGKSRRGLDRELAAHALGPLFDATRCADDAPSKPDPTMLLELLDELDVPAAQALMVGDTEYDMAMARAAGVDAVAVRSGVHAEERLVQFAPVAVVDHIGHVPELLRRPDSVTP